MKNKFDIVKIQGGLGNQMFEFSFGKWLEYNGRLVKFDVSMYKFKQEMNKIDSIHSGFELTDIFDIKIPNSTQFENLILGGEGQSIIAKTCRHLFKRPKTYYEYKMNVKNWYDENLLKLKNGYFDGYWCSFLFAEKIKKIIKDYFCFKVQLTKQNEIIREKIENSFSVSIHVRHGDYLKSDGLYYIPSVSYYKNAIQYFKTLNSDVIFFCFSDDIEWCKRCFSNFKADIIYVNWNYGKQSYIDMQLMSLCKNNIIANSTFSMWAAWLNSNSTKIVIRPERNFNEGYDEISDFWPVDWLVLNN